MPVKIKNALVTPFTDSELKDLKLLNSLAGHTVYARIGDRTPDCEFVEFSESASDFANDVIAIYEFKGYGRVSTKHTTTTTVEIE